MSINNLSEYILPRQAAGIIGCSTSRVYQYVKAGRLPAQLMEPVLLLPLADVEKFRNTSPQGRRRGNAPPWKEFKQAHLKLLATVIQVAIQPGMLETVHARPLNDVQRQEYRFSVNVVRSIMEEDGMLEIVLVWKNTEMPDEATRQQDLRVFQAAFEDALDWNTATYAFKRVLLHT